MKLWWLKSTSNKLSIPDWLSIYRILATPLLLALIFFDMRMFFGVFLLISFLTDALDGYFARKMNIVTLRGAQLDSIGDAITFMVGLIGIFKFETIFVMENLILILITFGLYLFQLILAYWRYGMPSSFHTYLAKLTAIIQSIFMCWLIFSGIEYWLFYVAIVFSIIETIEEIILIILFPIWKPNIKGLLWVLKSK